MKIFHIIFFYLLTLMAQSSFVDNNKTYLLEYNQLNLQTVYPTFNTNSFKRSIKNSVNITFKANFRIDYIWIFNSTGTDLFYTPAAFETVVSLPSNNFSFFIGSQKSTHSHLILSENNISVKNDTLINLKKENASSSAKYIFFRENERPIRTNTINFYFNNQQIKSTLNITIANIDSIAFYLYHNQLTNLKGEWSVKGKQLANAGNLYLLNDKLSLSENDSVINNDPLNLADARITYFLPDTTDYTNKIQLFTFIPDNHIFGENDPYYSRPLFQQIYQDINSDSTLKTSHFWQNIITNGLSSFNTTEIRLNRDKILGYHYRDTTAPDFLLSKTNILNLGVNPTYWFGAFYNKSDTIKIRSPFGRWQYPFLSLTNDVLNHYPFQFSLLKEEIVISTGLINLLTIPSAIRLGFNPDDLTYAVKPGRYKYTIKDNMSFVQNERSTTFVTAEFDLLKQDKNPPYLSVFQLFSDQVISNRLKNTEYNEIRFQAKDDYGLKITFLCLRKLNEDTLWTTLNLDKSANYFKTQLPNLSTGYYELKTYLEDSSANSIEMIIQPAFYYDNITDIASIKSINNSNISLKVYPNPFNLYTEIHLYAAEKHNQKYDLIMYDLLGRKIKTIYSGLLRPNSTFIWDGTNDYNNFVSTGIYALRVKGGDVDILKKVILIK